MKEKLNKAKEWIKVNKKRAAGIAVVVLLIMGAAGIGIAGINSVNASKESKVTAETEKSTSEKTVKESSNTKKDSDKKKEEDVADQEKKADDANSENDSATADEKKTDGGKQTADNKAASNTGSSDQTASSNSSESGSGNSSGQSHTHSYTTPVYGTEQKWVVDQAAWTETVNEPLYETVERSICNTCGADITGNTTAHGKETRHDGYHSEWIQVQTGTNTYTVPHPEVGHWESYSVVTGYQCSCGAVQ